MQTYYLICDESGAKGYSDKQEQKPCECGVMAGYILHDSCYNSVETALQRIVGECSLNTSGKLHITDLPQEQQELLRSKFFDFLIGNQIPCVFSAIYTEGLHQDFKRKQDIITKAKEKQKEKDISSNPPKPTESMHQRLFRNLFANTICWLSDHCLDLDKEQVQIIILTDTIDESVRQQFEEAINKYLQPRKVKHGGKLYDKKNKQSFRTEIHSSSLPSGEDYLQDLNNVSTKIQICDDVKTLVADVIANSLLHHFQQTKNAEPCGDLNTGDAIVWHKLEKRFYVNPHRTLDALYPHPSNKS